MLTVNRIFIKLRFTDSGRVSANWGPTLRGGFGTTLRRLVCAKKDLSCNNCILGFSCAYGYLFETPVPHDTEVMRLYPQAPHPFVFEPPLEVRSNVAAGEEQILGIVLIGRALIYLPYIILTLQELGKIGLGRSGISFEVISAIDESDALVYNMDESMQVKFPLPKRLNCQQGKQRLAKFCLRFETLLRLQIDGRLTKEPRFADIIANISRRVFLLQYFHTAGASKQPEQNWLEKANGCNIIRSGLEWEERSRKSTRQGREIPIGGLKGDIVFEGDLGTFLPVLKIGEYIHIGKNTAFGLGKFRLIEEPT